MSGDGIEIKIRLPQWRVTIGDVTFEFPLGTTREDAESVILEAKLRHLDHLDAEAAAMDEPWRSRSLDRNAVVRAKLLAAE